MGKNEKLVWAAHMKLLIDWIYFVSSNLAEKQVYVLNQLDLIRYLWIELDRGSTYSTPEVSQQWIKSHASDLLITIEFSDCGIRE